jgi:hypothetical protein
MVPVDKYINFMVISGRKNGTVHGMRLLKHTHTKCLASEFNKAVRLRKYIGLPK